MPRKATPRLREPWLGIEPSRGPLSGVRVVDFTWVFAGPIATRILSALGATVIKVEAPPASPEPRRPFLSRALHGGKLSTHLNVKDPGDAAAVRRLVASADVVVENFSTGVLDRFGLSWEQASAVNPGLVMTSISGMGRTGPYSHHVMLGQLAQAYSGLTSIVGYEGQGPRGIEDGGFWSDPVTGYAAAGAILSALRERSATGRGRRIDVSLVEATVATMFEPLLSAANGDTSTTRGAFDATMAPHDTYRCAPEESDSWLAIAVRDDREWTALCGVIGCPGAAGEPRFASLEQRQRHRSELRALIEGWTRARTADEAARACQAAGIAAAPSRSTADLVNDGHLRERQFLMTAPDGSVTGIAMPWRLHPEAPLRFEDAAEPGSSTALVRAET
jgi:benzylsuccinate CoA-transferase BbsF subunit